MSKLPVDKFFQLLRYAIGTSVEFPKDIPEEMWTDIYKIARQQALLGILFHGIQNNSSVRMEKSLLLQWYAVNEQIKGRNVVMNKKCVELTEMLKQDGFESCILKGQGNALLYEVRGESLALLRMPGDIDVWTMPGERSKDKGQRLKIREIIRYVKTKNPDAKACYHHVDYGMFKGVEVEVHYRPSFMFNPVHNSRLQKWFIQMADVGCQMAELPEGVGSVRVPNREFNVLFQLSHIYNHLLHEGIGLRQIIDYYYLLRKVQGSRFKVQSQLTVQDSRFKVQGSTKSLDETLKYLGLERIAGAVMWVLGYLVHGEGFMVHGFKRDEWMICEPDERRGKLLLDEIMKGGNFGQYDFDGRRKKEDGRVMKNIQRIKRDIRMVRYFPSECMWEPMFRVYHWFWRQWYN